MKNLLAITVVILFAWSANAKIVYLNNNLPEANIGENLFITWTDAYAACSPGDTIYVIGSNFSHGSVTISKHINIVGPGYFLNENLQTQVNKKTAIFGTITFAAGSEGSFLSGVSASSSSTSDISFNSGVDNITVTNCLVRDDLYLQKGTGTVNQNITVAKCFLNGGITRTSTSNGIYTNLVISNNIIGSGVAIPDGSTGIFSHNLCLGNTLRLGISSSFEVVNNIYLNTNSDYFTIQPLPDAAVHHNISITGVFGSENDNFTAPEGSLFIGGTNASTDGQYQLGNGSPAEGAGSGGVDIGPFGGSDPYRLSGLPNLPNIYELSTGGFVTGDSLPVRIKVKQ